MGKALTALVFVSLFVGGCATLSESQCIASDWQSIGYNDGAAGRTSSQLLKHQNACVKHGVVPDREIYLAGWHQGVEVYASSLGAMGQRSWPVPIRRTRASYRLPMAPSFGLAKV